MSVDPCGLRPIRRDAGEVVLTEREQQVAWHVARGQSNKTIAAELQISAWTVGGYLRRVYTKLGVRSRAAMVARLLTDAAATADRPS